jgi:hypothetical protein
VTDGEAAFDAELEPAGESAFSECRLRGGIAELNARQFRPPVPGSSGILYKGERPRQGAGGVTQY